MSAESDPLPEESSVPQGHYAGKTKILIVDDDPLTCRLVKIQLEMEGYTCVTLSDVERVVEVIETESPGVILIDFHLGTHGGLDLLRTIRSHEEYQYLPVIIMSGMDYKRESELVGANGFMLKPFSLQDLLATVQEVLNR
jgi:two-component system phosphate regulon response regulator PhoB